MPVHLPHPPSMAISLCFLLFEGIDCTGERRHRFHPPCRSFEYGDAQVAPALCCALAYEPIADWSLLGEYDARILGIQP